MNAPTPRPRLLLADADEPRRAQTRGALAEDFTLAEAVRADEVLSWLDQAAPGFTLLDHALPGAAGAELVARIRELFPDEIVLVVAPEPSIELCRAAMRAGAYDCLDRATLRPEQVGALCEAAAERVRESARTRGAATACVRVAVRTHEREAASRLCPPAALAAWRAVDLSERVRWLELWERAIQALDSPAERLRAVDDLLEALARQGQPSGLLCALHLHAASSVRPAGREDALERAREVLIEALQRLADRAVRGSAREPSSGDAPDATTGTQARAVPPVAACPPPRAPAPVAAGAQRLGDIPDLLWHRWCLADGGEEWTLVGEGRPLARVSVVADACRAYIRDAENGGRVVAALLPPVPNGLREVERRLGLPPVLTVRSASVA